MKGKWQNKLKNWNILILLLEILLIFLKLGNKFIYIIEFKKKKPKMHKAKKLVEVAI